MVCLSNAGVDHVGMHPGAVADTLETAVERQMALIDPIETPWNGVFRRHERDPAAGKRQQSPQPQPAGWHRHRIGGCTSQAKGSGHLIV